MSLLKTVGNSSHLYLKLSSFGNVMVIVLCNVGRTSPLGQVSSLILSLGPQQALNEGRSLFSCGLGLEVLATILPQSKHDPL